MTKVGDEVPKEIRKQLYEYDTSPYPKWKRQEIDECKHRIILFGYGLIDEEPVYQCEKCDCPFGTWDEVKQRRW